MFPTTDLIDTFTYANGDLSSVSSIWSTFGLVATLVVTSNQITAAAMAARGNYYNVDTFADCESWFTIATLPGASDVALASVRVNPATLSGYDVHYTPGTLSLRRSDSGVITVLQTMSLTLAAGDGIGISVIGTTFRAFTRSGTTWTHRLTATDANYASGRLALFASGSTVRLDQFGGGRYGVVPLKSVLVRSLFHQQYYE